MEEVAKNIFIEVNYDEVNVGAVVTPSGVFCIDVPSYARDARDWAARMHRLSPYPVQGIFLTDASGDRILNTRWLNAPIIMHQNAAQQLNSFDKKYPQHLIDSLIARNPHRGRELNNGQAERSAISFSGETVMYKYGHEFILHHKGGPSAGNAWITLPASKVLFCGDSLMVGTYPHLLSKTSAKWIDSLKELKTLFGTYTIVPGRGSAATPSAVDVQISYLTRMRETVIEYIKAGQDRDFLSKLVKEFNGAYPASMHPTEWTKQAILTSLENVYDEVQSKLAQGIEI